MQRTDRKIQWRLTAAFGLLLPVTLLAQTGSVAGGSRPAKSAILSSSRLTDSLGETVYEIRGRLQQDQPPVAGAFTVPAPLNRSFADYPESMRRKKQDGEVEIEGVVARDGRFIDLKVTNTTDPEFNQNSFKAAGEYLFQPATLDGKPIACLLRIEMTFTIH